MGNLSKKIWNQSQEKKQELISKILKQESFKEFSDHKTN
jgi:hypothetical protein